MRSSRLFILTAVWSACLPSCGLADDLPACANKYGELMVQHWLNVSSAQQLERLLFYRPDLTADLAPRLQKQKFLVEVTERQLDVAAKTYADTYKSGANEDAERLTALLKDVSAEALFARRSVRILLTEAGRKVAGDDFNASPISDEQLAPAWDDSVIGDNYQPKRLLFGSTGRVGDGRILPLRFDFGSGIYSFIVPMAARDELAIEKPPAVHEWMRQQHMGYHYWAGVFNNQNTYVADWFINEFGDDDDVWMKLANGKVLPSAIGSIWGQPNIWNPHVRDYMRSYCESQSRFFHDDSSLVCYDYAGEPHPYGAQPPGQPQYSGYNDSAIMAFRQYLKEKFKTIEALNLAWKSDYRDFGAIGPGPDPYVIPLPQATPLSYEFERFRCDGQTKYWKLVYDAYRKHDPKKPIEAHASMYMSGWPAQAMDAYQMLKAGVADWIDMHQNNFPPNLPEQIYLYSLCRLTGRVPVEFEYIWTFPRTGPVDEANESDFRATCQASVWRNLVWGKRALVFFDFYYDWPSYHNAMFDKELGYSILRSSACVIPAIKCQALRFSDLFLNTEVEEPPIIVLQPSASVLNSPPIHPNQGFSFHTNVGMKVHELLYPHNYPFLYVPEEAVLEDAYDLSKHRVIILPQAPYLPAAMSDALLEWVRNGGTLISVGVPGIWSPYGEDDLRLVKQVFGESRVTDTDPGKWKWQWQLLKRSAGVEAVSNDAAGNVSQAAARYGKGAVLIATSGFDSSENKEKLYETLDRAIGNRPARSAKDAFELTIRIGKGGRYMCVLNPDTRETREDEIIVQGKYAGAQDLGIGSGVPLPVEMQNGATHFRLRLHPGESTVILLEP